jgi:hypothetical protein
VSRSRQFFPFWGILLAIYFLGWYLQSQLLLNWDVSWLMHVSQKMLAGGHYVKDYFEINPPMILYLYAPSILVHQIFSLSLFLSLRLLVFLFISFSLFSCYALLKLIFAEEKNAILSTLFFVIAAIFLLLPAYEFGQREHLLVIFSMPYFLLAVCRLQNRGVAWYFALMVGVFAGFGLAIKPYFFILPVLIEMYLMFSCKKISTVIRIETVTFSSIFLLYLLSIYRWFGEYIDVIIPVTLQHHYTGFNTPLLSMLLSIQVVFCFFALIFYATTLERRNYFNAVFTLALMGALLIYFLQRETWYYHIYPALSFATLLVVSLFCEQVKESSFSVSVIFLNVIFGIFILAIPISTAANQFHFGVIYKKNLKDFISFLHENADNKSIYIVAATSVYEYPAVDYAGAVPVSRFGFMGWVPGVLGSDNPLAPTIKNYFVDLIATDLNEKKPSIVFVDTRQKKPYLEKYPKFDYISYFSKNDHFREAWKSYRYTTHLSVKNIYEFDVYSLR